MTLNYTSVRFIYFITLSEFVWILQGFIWLLVKIKIKSPYFSQVCFILICTYNDIFTHFLIHYKINISVSLLSMILFVFIFTITIFCLLS